MASNTETRSLAVLIDVDNATRHAQATFDETVDLGEANVDSLKIQYAGGGRYLACLRPAPIEAKDEFQ